MLSDETIVRNKDRSAFVQFWIYLRREFSKKNRLKLNRKLAEELKDIDFTIFSNNCLGGVFYHDAGLEFKSPTVNMGFDGEDFIKFCENPKKYLTDDFSFFKWPGFDYPLAKNKDIEIKFVHYGSESECVEKWVERSKRIVWDNIFIIASDIDGLNQEKWMKRFDALPYENKIMFTAKEYPQYNWAIPVRQFRKRNMVHIITLFADFKGERYYETAFDIAGWIKEKSL